MIGWWWRLWFLAVVLYHIEAILALILSAVNSATVHQDCPVRAWEAESYHANFIEGIVATAKAKYDADHPL